VRREPSTTPARRVGYRLLGRGFDFLLHLRPAEWPIMAAHTAVGYILAVGWSGVWHGEQLGRFLLGLAIWVVLLNGGTLAINSAFDRDEGDIGYLPSPPPVPRGLGLAALGLMAAGQGLALLLPPLFAKVYAICFVMSIIYSVPPLRLKAVAGFDWVINMWGFGTLTALAGYAVTGRPISTVHALVLLAFCPLFAALYPLTQLYQFEADRQRGDRTLALVLGMRLSLQVAVVAVLLAFALFAAAAILAGWGLGVAPLGRWLGLGVALVAWLRVLMAWLRDYRIWTPVEHQRGMYDALAAWALTDLIVLAAWAT
jgi:4-hydroxybenzoate polyprenyltransferase